MTKGSYMSKCKKNILLIFGYLLLMAVLFVPYKYEKDIFHHATDTLGPEHITEEKQKYIFSPLFIRNILKYREFKDEDSIATIDRFWLGLGVFEKLKMGDTMTVLTYYYVNTDLLITEFAIIIFAGGFLYILFCVVLRKSEKRREK